jgi:AcrB/AcrD/AcrF family
MVPTALALEKGSEANAPLGRAILGGLLAGEPATLFVVPALYALMIRGKPVLPRDPAEQERLLAEGDNQNDRADEQE